MKTCKHCSLDLSEENFYKQIQRSPSGKICNYLDSICKTCRKIYSLNRRRELKRQCVEYLGGACKDCGLIDDPVVYDFHHLDPSKKELAFGDSINRSFESLKTELDKCVCLCANCHRKRHLLPLQNVGLEAAMEEIPGMNNPASKECPVGLTA